MKILSFRGVLQQLLSIGCFCFGLLGWANMAPAQDKAFIWLEGEQPTKCNVKPNLSGWGNKQFLSDEKWLSIAVAENLVEKEIPAEGVLIEYDFKAPAPAKYDVWGRIGYEFARSPFDWRMDGGEWKTVSPNDLTSDLVPLAEWCEVAWLKLGDVQLTAGEHKLEFRIRKDKDDKGKPKRILFGLDAVCLSAGPFQPYLACKPGQDHRTDKDKQAAQQTFQLPAATADGSRISLPLNGLWEASRNDEQTPGEVAEPMKDLPLPDARWSAIEVPGDKGKLRPDLELCHRLWYRTKVNVPADYAGKSFYLVFPENNLNTTVYVNGQLCGFDKNPFVRVQIDVSKAIKPGVNEILVGIRDAWYGYSTNPNNPMKLRKVFNLPRSFLSRGFQDYAYPIWNHSQSGILITPAFVAAGGPVYVSDVFCKPSVSKKQLALEVTVKNPTGQDAAGELVCEAVNAKTGQVEKVFPAKPFNLPAGKDETLQLAEAWDNAKLWWPDDPNLYTLRTTVKIAGKSADVANQTFGFREWGWQGKNFTLNGVPFHGWADTFTAPSKEKWLELYKKNNQTVMRFWGTRWLGLTPDDALDFFDKNGVVVRRSGTLDGETIGYMAAEQDPDLKKLYNADIKMQLMNNWLDQMVAQVKGERNHPSVMIWSIENEWLFINCINLYGGLMDKFEAEVKRVADAVLAADPTRPTMNDGGGAHKNNAMPVAGDHYLAFSNPGGITAYPNMAYEANPKGAGRGRWEWDQKRPRFVGEDYFYEGFHPELSTVGGEVVFGGKSSTLQACALMKSILQQGYRWADYGAWHYWIQQSSTDGSEYKYFAPRAALARQWDWTFASGQPVKRLIGIFNDTHHPDPITFTWTLNVNGQKVAGESKDYTVAPGTRQEVEITLPMPKVEARTEGELTLTLAVKGQEVFKDAKPVSILNTAPAVKSAGLAGLNVKNLLVYDPTGNVAEFLKAHSIAFTSLTDLKNLPPDGKVLVIGKDALSTEDSTSTRLAAYALAGRTVIVLEQKNPLKFQALPAEMEPDTNEGRIAFGEDSTHPALKGLKDKDFFTWAPDEILFRNAYVKPARGGKSLLQCGDTLKNCGLAEVSAGKGLLLLSQIVVGEKLKSNPVAQQLLLNLLEHGATYKQSFRPVLACVEGSPDLAKALDRIGVAYTRVADPLAALAQPGSIAVIAATPTNLKTLADNLPKVEAFTQGGGWIVFNNLTPEGIESYDKIVGFEHIIRPFGGTPTITNAGVKSIEVVVPSAVRDPLMAGVSTGDVALYSSKKVFNFRDGCYPDPDGYSYVVDIDEVAPFGKSKFAQYGNITNGYVNEDGWPLIINFPLKKEGNPDPDKDGKPDDIPITFPKPQTFTEFTWIGNMNYYPTTKVNLIFDGDKANMMTIPVQPTGEPQTFKIDPPRTAKDVTLQVAEWQPVEGKSPFVGIDNIYFKVQRPKEFYEKVKPMLNIGAMMRYPKGEGGIVLCNLKFKDTEEVPLNKVKKQNILATILRNLKAPLGGKTILAGANLTYHPVDLSKQANQYRTERGWFGDKNHTFADLPIGKQSFANITFDVYEFATSPVPTCIMLGGKNVPNNLPNEVKGIPVNQKADALFFLQAARLDKRMNDQERKAKKTYVLCKYVVNYADGQKEELPIYAEVDVDNYIQNNPASLSGAQIGWTQAYADKKNHAVAYVKQWNNPRPDVEIKTVDLVYGDPSRGVPVLLALTAATAAQ